MRPAAALFLPLLVSVVAGCGGSGPAAGDRVQFPSPARSRRWRAPGEDVAVVAGTSDYEPGRNRVSFLIVDKSRGSSPRRRPGCGSPATRRNGRSCRRRRGASASACPAGRRPTRARSTSLTSICPTQYWLLAEPAGPGLIQAIGNVVVRGRTMAPGYDRAAVTTPTLASVHGHRAAATTSKRPDPALYRTSATEAKCALRALVRDAAVLQEPHLRAGRGRRLRRPQAARGERRHVHPRGSTRATTPRTARIAGWRSGSPPSPSRSSSTTTA